MKNFYHINYTINEHDIENCRQQCVDINQMEEFLREFKSILNMRGPLTLQEEAMVNEIFRQGFIIGHMTR